MADRAVLKYHGSALEKPQPRAQVQGLSIHTPTTWTPKITAYVCVETLSFSAKADPPKASRSILRKEPPVSSHQTAYHRKTINTQTDAMPADERAKHLLAHVGTLRARQLIRQWVIETNIFLRILWVEHKPILAILLRILLFASSFGDAEMAPPSCMCGIDEATPSLPVDA